MRFRGGIFVFVLLALIAMIGGCRAKGMTLAAVGYLLPEELPPDRGRFDTYALFVACSQEEAGPTYATLRDRFEVFGARIGEKNAAVWVAEPNIPGLSVSKGEDLVRRYRIAYGDNGSRLGPLIIISNLHFEDWPKEPTQANGSGLPVAISFRDRSPDGIGMVFDCLRQCVSSPDAGESVSRRFFQCRSCGIVVVPGAIDGDEG